MALDPSIALSGRPAPIMTPGEQISLQQLSGQVQDQQMARQNLVGVRNALQRPGAFDPETGLPSAQTIGEVGKYDPHAAFQWFQQTRIAHTEQQRIEAAKLAQEAKLAGAQAQATLRQAQADKAKTAQQKEQEALHASTWKNVFDRAVADYEAARNDPARAAQANDIYRKSILDQVDLGERSGKFLGMGMKQEAIDFLKQNIPEPDAAKRLSQSAAERATTLRAQLDSPYKIGSLAVANRRADTAEARVNIADVGNQIKADTLEAHIDEAERKAGIAEDVIAYRKEHGKAMLDLREAKQLAAKDTADTSAEERERHNRALEEAKAREQDLRGKAYGERAEKTSLLTGKPGGERTYGTTLLKADKQKESQIATLNRELDSGAITQEQHDAAIAKLTAQGGKGGAGGGVEVTVGASKAMAARGFMADPDNPGGLTFVPGGPADPKVISRAAEAKRGGKTNTQSTALSEVGYEGPQLHGDEFLEKQVRPEWHDKIRAIDKNPKLVQTLGRTKEERAMLASLAIQYNPKWGQDSGKGGEGESLSPGGLKVAVELARQGITLPGGYSKQGISRGNRILNEMARDEAGGSGSGAAATGIMEGKAKAGAIKAFASGKQGQNATAINTAIGHLGTVDELASALGNKDTRVLNAIFNRIATETGNAKVNNYEIAVDAVGHELMRVFRQVGASEGETKAWEAKFRASNSPEQLRGAVKTAVELLQSRINALNDEYNRSTGSTGGYPNMLSPKSIKVIERLGGHVSSGADSGPKGKPPPPSGSAPGAAAAGPRTETPNSKIIKWGDLK